MSWLTDVRAAARYVWVVLLTGCALAISLILEPLIEPDFSPLFLGTITLSTALWGVRAGVLCAALSAGSLLLLFLPPHFTMVLLSWPVFFRELSFLASAALIMWLVKRAVVAERNLTRSLEEIRAREERFRVALLRAPVVVFHQDANLRYTWVYNPLPEFASAPLVGKTDFDLFPPAEAELLTQVKRQVLSNGVGIRREVVLTAGPTIRVCDTTLEPFRDIQGNVVGLLGAAVDITDRKRVEEELRNSREQLRGLAAHLQSMQETERALTAREIHDNVTQTLAALDIQLSVMTRMLSAGRDPAAVAESMEKISAVLGSTIERSEQISSKLRPSLLDNLGLAAAIESHTQAFEAQSGIHAITGPLVDAPLAPEISTAIFRVFQEALTNVKRHAQATQVSVSLWREGRHVLLRVGDNGRGITPDELTARGSLGLLGMQEQVHSFGGEISIHGVAAEGTTVCVAIPVEEAQGAPEQAECRLARPTSAGAAAGNCPIDGRRCARP